MESEEKTNEIRDYLKGRLSEDEAAAFRKRMGSDPALEEEVAFARLMLGGLQEIARRKTRLRKWRNMLLAFALFLAMLLAAYLILKARKTSPPENTPSIVRAMEDQQQAPFIKGGGDSSQKNSDRGASIVWNSRGEAILAGQFIGVSEFGDHKLSGFGKEDIFIAACDPGEFRWARQIGSVSGTDFCEKTAVDSGDNILLTGRICDNTDFLGTKVSTTGNDDGNEGGEFFIAKLNPDGKLLWLDHAGGNTVAHAQTGPNMGTAIVADPFDNVIAAGAYIGSPKFGNAQLPTGGPNEDLYLAKYDPDGQLQWVKAVTCNYMIYANDLAADHEGNIYLTGFFGHHNLGGTAVFDNIVLNSYGGRDIFVAKYKPDGTLDWVRQAGSPNLNGRDFGQSVAVGTNGSCVVTGWFEGTAKFGHIALTSQGNRDVFLANYDLAGNLLWASSYGGQGADQGNGVCLDKEGNIFCTGHISGKASFGRTVLNSIGEDDVFVAKINPAGKLQWVKLFGGDHPEPNSDSSTGIAIDALGRLVVTGFFSGNLQVGDFTVASQGKEDIFLLFFDKNGKLLDAMKILYL